MYYENTASHSTSDKNIELQTDIFDTIACKKTRHVIADNAEYNTYTLKYLKQHLIRHTDDLELSV